MNGDWVFFYTPSLHHFEALSFLLPKCSAMNHRNWNSEEQSKSFQTSRVERETTEPSSFCDVKDEQRAPKNSVSHITEEEMASWFLYPPYELLQDDLDSGFFCETADTHCVLTAKPNSSFSTEVKENIGFSFSESNPVQEGVLSNSTNGFASGRVRTEISNLSCKRKERDVDESGSPSVEGDCNSADGKKAARRSHRNRAAESHSLSERVRKERDVDESGSPSVEGDCNSADGKKAARRSHRNRAAESHSLSERRRRDRINEKMRALQDLIPNCSKLDKAAMLDEAIEYMKFLQQQVQMMWMGNNMMSSMIFPSIQDMAQLGIGNLLLLHRVPQVSQSVASKAMFPLSISHLGFPHQMHCSQMPETIAQYFVLNHTQPSRQEMNLFAFGSQMAHQNQTAAAISSSFPAFGLPPEASKRRKG
ncbi:hypothetical protein HPP92_016669 [Vanilla planifolia]|uniref:BHLH domain-containing protein n=1 Tax=Vanilla planifolia TaxID=51239 RepID=A0A835QCN3_VANPL|nr:hypothetical protein HPP92_016669 [Vanilla planifolia]